MAGFAIVRPDTAFANAAPKGKKRPREHDRDHLAWLATLPCIITGKRPVHVAHIRYADPVYGKGLTGTAEKPSDKWSVPLLASLHLDGPDAQHGQNERLFWAKHGLDPLRIALALHTNTGDDQQAEVILREAWRTASAFETALDRPSFNPEIQDGDHE